MFVNHAALAVENSRLFEQSVHLSHTDWLTGLWNTRYFDNMLEKSIEKALENETPVSLIIIDIDNFKKFNDSLGHQEGDRAIKTVASALERHCRIGDFVARYGGEEFCIVMTRIDAAQALKIAERLRKQIEKIFKDDKSIPQELKLTVSLGIAAFPDDGTKKEDLIRKADKALYRAKRSGKNMTCLHSPETE
jgi:diguanylate cyclase (GGDEF)-like protein